MTEPVTWTCDFCDRTDQLVMRTSMGDIDSIACPAHWGKLHPSASAREIAQARIDHVVAETSLADVLAAVARALKGAQSDG